jgi:plastocyanin
MSTAQMMNVMAAAPAAPGQMTHTVSTQLLLTEITSNSQQVTVGGLKAVSTGMAPSLAYSPEAITAAVGDVVEFVFMQKNHTVTQSTFAAPCNKMDGGMDSGFMPNPDGKAGVTWNMTVSTTEPLCKPLSLIPESAQLTSQRVLLQTESRHPLRSRYGLLHQRKDHRR